MALAAVVAVGVLGHEDAGPTGGGVALDALADDLVVHIVDLVELQHGQLLLLPDVLLLLRAGVLLLLALLPATEQTQREVERGLGLHSELGQRPLAVELLALEQETLLLARDAGQLEELKMFKS